MSGSPLDWTSTATLLIPKPSGPLRTPTPTLEIDPSLFFDHPDGSLSWDGPIYRLYTLLDGHCGSGDIEFGVPGYVNADGVGFYGARRVQREEAWHWTGYQHNEWQIWQGGEPLILYLVNSEEPRYAYEYRWQRGCY